MSDKTPASRQLLNITKAALDSAERECETIRNAVIEECARVAESFEEAEFGYNPTAVKIATAIRAPREKDNPLSYAIKYENRYWGPFKTADAAAKWAIKNFVDSYQYQIVLIKSPSAP